MERNFKNEDFEKLLRDNANQYRMYPSEKVWNGVYSALHTRRRWYGISAGIMLLITASIISVFIFNNKPKNEIANAEGFVGSVKKNTASIPDKSTSKVEEYTPEIKNTLNSSPINENLNNGYLNTFSLDKVTSNPESNSTHSEVAINSNPELLDNRSIENNPEIIVPAELSVQLKSNEKINEGIYIIKNDEPLHDINVNTTIAEQSFSPEEENKKLQEALSALASQNTTITIPQRSPKLSAQVYFTPTVSYRSLTENKEVYTGAGFNYVPSIDIDNVVKHKPAMGLEFGIEGRYQLNEKLSLKSGFQFNINRYDIRAYSHPTEIATVRINSSDSMASLSNYRNFSGNSPNWLENFYFQAAVPVGVEFIIAEKNNTKFGVSGTIQPTYVIGDRAYVISSDYKNYAKFPELMRRWNLSTGLGAFVSYSTGKINWQVGPHLRYQHFSSFVNALSVKEKLFSAGLKIGATINKK